VGDRTGRRSAGRHAACLAGLALALSSCAASGSTPDEGGRADPIPGASVECGLGSFEPGRWPTPCWRPYADTSPFNRPVPADPRVLPDSDAIVAKVLDTGPIADLVVPSDTSSDTSSDWYHPAYFPRPDDPAYTVHCVEDWGRCEVEGMRVPIPAEARPANGGDAHMAVVDQSTGWEYDFWQVRPRPAGGGTLNVSWGGRTKITGDGLGSDATAAHFGLLAGTIRAAEMQAGRIDHALFMTVGCTAHRYVYPAAGHALTCAEETHAPAVGQHFWLDMTDAEIRALGVPRWKQTILRALARYGAYVGDTGGNEAFGFQFESGRTFTSFGVDDPMVAFAMAQQSGVTAGEQSYYFHLGPGVDWRGRLRALDPCVTQRGC
jgi:hypothetical protein